jgi:hypothetical protein
MEQIRKKSLSSFLKIALNTVFYFELIIFVILLGGVTFSFLTNDERQFRWPVSFTNSSLNEIGPAKDGFDKVEILAGAGELFFIDANNWQNMSITYFGLLLNFGIVLFVTYHLKKIVSTFTKRSPFIKLNVARVRYIGLALVIFPVLDLLFDFIYVQYLNANLIWESQGQFTLSFDFIILLLGLLIILIAEIFRLGVSFREESDLTI